MFLFDLENKINSKKEDIWSNSLGKIYLIVLCILNVGLILLGHIIEEDSGTFFITFIVLFIFINPLKYQKSSVETSNKTNEEQGTEA